MQPIAPAYVSNAFPWPLLPLTRALPPSRYGLYALRGRSPATLVSPLPPPLHNAEGNDGTHSDRQQVGGVLCVACMRLATL